MQNSSKDLLIFVLMVTLGAWYYPARNATFEHNMKLECSMVLASGAMFLLVASQAYRQRETDGETKGRAWKRS